MRASIERVNLTYEEVLSAPLFDLPSRGTALLHSLHKAIHPRYSIPPTHMQIFGGNAMSDVRIRITLFNGNGIIDVTVDKISIAFNDLLGREDIDICKDCISTTDQVIRSFFTDLRISFVSVNPTVYISLDEAAIAPGMYLSGIISHEFKFDLDKFENAIQYPGVNLTVGSSTAGWNVIFHAFQNASAASSLVVSCHAQYLQGGQISELEEKNIHLHKLFVSFLEGIGLEIADSPLETRFGAR